MRVTLRSYQTRNHLFCSATRAALVFMGVIAIQACVFAQDIHYSQFYNAPFQLNPALTGLFRGDTRIQGNYRSQWQAVPVDYQTVTVALDHKFMPRMPRSGFFSGGLSANHDQAGFSNLRLLNIGLNGSYTQKMSDHLYFSVGAQGSFNQRQFNIDDLKFDNQFDPNLGAGNPGLGTGENFANMSNGFMDLAAGVNLRVQALTDAALVDRLEKRSKLDVGMGFYHINRPDQSFDEEDSSPLPFRLSPYALGTIQMGRNVDLIANITGQFQGQYVEGLGLLGGRFHLNRSLGKQIALQFGLGYRFNRIGDSMMPVLEVFYNNWRVGFNYDVNVSEFEIATDRRGGPELSVQYIFSRVRPLPSFKICPII